LPCFSSEDTLESVMPDEMIDSLRKAYMKDKDNTADDCQMSDQIAEYAFGELDPDEAKKVKEHLSSCRSCLDLYMDIKMAEEDERIAKGEKVEVLSGLQQALDKGKKPTVSPWQKISGVISDFFSEGFGLKPAMTFVTVAMVMIIGFYVYQGTTVKTPYGIEIMMQGRTQVGFRGGQPEFKEFTVASGGKMTSGDYFRFQAKIDRDAFVYVVFQDSSRSIISQEVGFIAGGSDLILPNSDQWFQLDDNTGNEKLYLVASEDKIDDFSNRVKKMEADGVDSIEKVFPKATIQSFSFRHQ
jgi:hypothetical protein